MCVAVPVLDRAGRIGGALSVAGPTVRFSRRDAESIVPALRRAADQLIHEFSGVPEAARRAPELSHPRRLKVFGREEDQIRQAAAIRCSVRSVR